METDAARLKELLQRGAVRVKVRLPSGDCWATLRAVRAHRGAASLVVSCGGVELRLPVDAVRSVATGD